MDTPEDAPEEIPSFQILCPACKRDSDAPDVEFLLTAVAILEQSEFVLAESVCGACEARLDVAVWPIDGPALLAEAGGDMAVGRPVWAEYPVSSNPNLRNCHVCSASCWAACWL